ncbi:hypothetical protein EXE40_17185 [Halorubrum sp. GN11GM_10-3_MGM]|nr:hypothetical protein EXE40_17185 [Halorubrum sp. GN11GM_10-3_MGM]
MRPPPDCPFESLLEPHSLIASHLPSFVGLPSVGRLPRACSSRPPMAAARRHAPPHRFVHEKSLSPSKAPL